MRENNIHDNQTSTSTCAEEDIEAFCDEITTALDDRKTVLIEKFNAKPGQRPDEEQKVGKFGKRNEIDYLLSTQTSIVEGITKLTV